MIHRRPLAILALVAAAALSHATTAVACPLDRPIGLAGLDWGSAAFHNAVVEEILETGYQCETHTVPGQTIPLFGALTRGEVDIMMELWKANMPDAWDRAVAAGQVRQVGVSIHDSVQGWFVPRYLVEGPNASAPTLRSVFDLPRHKDLFVDRSSGGKGQFFNCTKGWGCEIINTKKFAAYGLEHTFINVRPTSGAGLVAAIASRYKRQAPFVAYYWTPTWVAGTYDLVRLEEPSFDAAKWDRMISTAKPREATAYPSRPVGIAVNNRFAARAPELVNFLGRYNMDAELISKALAFMEEHKATPDQAASEFLLQRQESWARWVPAEVAQRIRAGL